MSRTSTNISGDCGAARRRPIRDQCGSSHNGLPKHGRPLLWEEIGTPKQ